MSALTEYFHKKYYSDMPIETVNDAIYGSEDTFNAAVNHVQQTHYSDVDPTVIAAKVGGRVPIKVTDPNDAGLRAFNDSNTIRNAANRVYSDYYLKKFQLGAPNANGDYGNPNRSQELLLDIQHLKREQDEADAATSSWHDTFGRYGGINAMPFSHDRHSENKGGHGGNFFEKGWDAAVEKNPKLREIQQRILPTNMSLEEEFQADLYKAPVQPYILDEKPNNIVKTKPVVKQQTVVKQPIVNKTIQTPALQKKTVNKPVDQIKTDTVKVKELTKDTEPTMVFQGRDFMDRTGLTPGNYSLKQVNEMLKIKGYPEVKDNRSMSYLTKLK
ncbi:MAG: hypothetical protein WCO04_01545 [Pseudomonadota bacterium]